VESGSQPLTCASRAAGVVAMEAGVGAVAAAAAAVAVAVVVAVAGRVGVVERSWGGALWWWRRRGRVWRAEWAGAVWCVCCVSNTPNIVHRERDMPAFRRRGLQPDAVSGVS
jgi:hypothetical protein